MRWVVPWCLVVVVSTGCAESGNAAPGAPPTEKWSTSRPTQNRLPPRNQPRRDKAKSSQPPGAETLQRKIIHTATLTLVVEHFDPVPEEVAALVDRFGAYVARSQITGAAGSLRRGQWTVRVPVERYEALPLGRRQAGRDPQRQFRLPGRDRGVLRRRRPHPQQEAGRDAAERSARQGRGPTGRGADPRTRDHAGAGRGRAVARAAARARQL